MWSSAAAPCRERAAKTDKIATGDVELYVSELRVLSEAQTPPFEIRDGINVGDELRLRYRYLDLRRPSVHEPIVLRSKVCQIIRNYFCDNHFCEIETPHADQVHAGGRPGLPGPQPPAAGPFLRPAPEPPALQADPDAVRL